MPLSVGIALQNQYSRNFYWCAAFQIGFIYAAYNSRLRLIDGQKLTVKAAKFSESAKAKIEAAGGKAEVI